MGTKVIPSTRKTTMRQILATAKLKPKGGAVNSSNIMAAY